jgi:competence protein ComEA
MNLPDWLREYLRYYRRERIGLQFLLGLLLVVIAFNVWHRLTLTDRAARELIVFGPSMAVFGERVAANPSEESSVPVPSWAEKRPGRVAERFDFDPNTLDSSGWVRLGFSPKQTSAILRFRERSGGFGKEEDLLKLFVVDSALYQELLPFIQMEKRVFPEKRTFEPRPARPLPVVDINLADSLGLEELKGIGPSFARRIVRYRERLGGFISTAQLLEVYGMDTARWEAMLPQVTMDTSAIVRIDINTADYTELIRHPYLNRNQVRAIIRYREQHGAFRSVEGLLAIHIVTADDLARLRPYLKAD